MRQALWDVLVRAVGIVAALSASPHLAEAAAITVPGGASIAVRTYTRPDSVDAMRTARRIASAALEHVDIQVAWVECGLPAAPGQTAADTCSQPLRSNELVVRVVSGGAVDGGRHGDALGFAFVDVHAGGGSLATVYANRVENMAQLSGVDAAELLGRAMAHEIGHLLLGTNQHARHGLMRASWSGADLRRGRGAHWLFAGKEGEVMRRRIASRPGS